MHEIFNCFKENLRLIIPSFCLCVDETLHAFRGKCFCRQFIPSKPARYGIKFWCLVDTVTGLTEVCKKNNLEIYLVFIKSIYLMLTFIWVRRKKQVNERLKLAKMLFLNLCKPYFFSNRLICADNFFSSIPLCQKLWENGCEYIGTLR